MNIKLTFALAAAAAFTFVGQSHAQFVINEIESDTYNGVGGATTDYREFIEIFALTGSTTALDGLTLVLFNGGNGAATADSSYRAFDLDGFFTDANGYFVFGTTNVPEADETTLLGAGNILQNGQDTALGHFSWPCVFSARPVQWFPHQRIMSAGKVYS